LPSIFAATVCVAAGRRWLSPTNRPAGSALALARRLRQGAFLLSFAMDDHHILILSILVGMAAAGIVLGTILVHAHE
jgi:hypothetical protein